MKILLVQNGMNGTALHQYLVALGHELLTCRTADEAKEQCERDSIPLVILEIEQLESKAVSLCRWLRRRESSLGTFILLVAPQSLAEHARELLSAGADDVLLKPWDIRIVGLKLMCIEHQVKQRFAWLQSEQVLSTRAQQQVAIAALGQCALSSDLPTVTALLKSFIMHTLEVEFCGLWLLTLDSQSLECADGFGWHEGCIGSISPLPPPQSINAHTLAGEDVLIDDLEHDERFIEPELLLRKHGIISGVSVAIRGKTGVLGILGAYTGRPRKFLEADLRFVEGLACVFGATTERKRNEAEIQQQQAQVQHLQKLESVGQLAAGLAHDYNNMLTIIHGHVALVLRDAKLPQKWATSLKTALEAVEHAATLSRQLLTFSRKQPIHLTPLDLDGAVAGVTRLLVRVLGENIHLEVQANGNLPAIEGDIGMLEQAITNLAINARDAMPQGGKLVFRTTLELITATRAQQHAEAREGGFVCLSVIDNGCGMDAATLHRIFEPFFTTKGPGKGTGLGLATVFGIVKQHQGWIQVESKLGEGTTFRLFLPSLGITLRAPETAAPVVNATRGTETILLVEDESTLRALARLLLEDLGYHVLEAGSGVEALKLWAEQKEKIQVLLADLVMPDGVSGFELAERLGTERPDLKVIFASGYTAEEARKGMQGKQNYQFLQKPYRTETLAQAIRAAMD